jgi:hypothetical protein
MNFGLGTLVFDVAAKVPIEAEDAVSKKTKSKDQSTKIAL